MRRVIKTRITEADEEADQKDGGTGVHTNSPRDGVRGSAYELLSWWQTRKRANQTVMKTAASALGIFVMIAAIAVGALAAVGVFSEAPTSSRTSRPQPAATETTRAELTASVARKSVTAGDVSWTVTDARRTSELHKDTTPPQTQTGNFVIVTFTVENVSDEPVTLSEESVALIDEEGHKFPAQAFINSGYVDPEKNILFNERSLLEPGVTREGKVNFAVSADASGFRAQLGDVDPTVNEERYVDLGF